MGYEINGRIQFLIRDVLDISPYEFSKTIGNKRPDGLYKILDNKTKPSPKTLDKISESYPNLNMNWLLNGEGPVLKEGKNYLSGDEDEVEQMPVENGILKEEYQKEEENLSESNVTDSGQLNLKTVRDEVRGDLKIILDGMTENFRVINDGVFHMLKDQQKVISNQEKVLHFIDDMDKANLRETAKGLDAYLKQRQK